jgi:hypothetical protein
VKSQQRSYARIAYEQSIRTGIAVRPRAIVLSLKTGRHLDRQNPKRAKRSSSIVIATLPWMRADAASRQK